MGWFRRRGSKEGQPRISIVDGDMKASQARMQWVAPLSPPLSLISACWRLEAAVSF